MRIGRQPGASVNPIVHLGVDVIAGGIAQMEGHGGLTLCQDALFHIDAQGRLAIADGQRYLAHAGLTAHVGHVGGHHKVVEQWMVALGQRHWHVYFECAVVGCRGLAAADLLVIAAVADDTQIPVATVTPPPERLAAHHLVSDTGSLHGHAGIRTGGGTGLHRVAGLIVGLHFVEGHLKCRALVFLHPEAHRLAVGHQRELTCQP